MANSVERDILMESGSDPEASTEAPHRGGIPVRVVSLLGAAAAVAVLGYAGSSVFGPAKARVSGLIQKSNWQLSGTFNPEGVDPAYKRSAATSPDENLNDGNKCADDEEEFMQLCYKKCSILTRGTHQYRTSAFTCCQADSKESCSLTNQEVNTKICGGFDVAGSVNGQESACPHGEGTCFENEELYIGQCYKKCSILTNNEYSNRVTPYTCCKTTGVSCNPFGFGDAGNVKSSSNYNVGGKDTASNTVPAHYPDPSITESSSGSSSSSGTATVASS